MQKKKNRIKKTKILAKLLPANEVDWLIWDCAYASYEVYQTLMVQFHPTFVNDFTKIQDDFRDLSCSYPIEDNCTKLDGVLNSLEENDRARLSSSVSNLLQKYPLEENWSLSLQIKILTNILPIPYASYNIRYHDPIIIEERAREAMSPASSIAMRGQYHSNYEFPAIHILQNLHSPTELKNWIDENWKTKIEPSLEFLPKKLNPQLDVDRLGLGIWFSQLRRSMSWQEIDNEITNVQNSDPDFFGIGGKFTPDISQGSDLINSAEEIFRKFHS